MIDCREPVAVQRIVTVEYKVIPTDHYLPRATWLDTMPSYQLETQKTYSTWELASYDIEEIEIQIG